jgi:NADH-quinone oxidoreductase subunit L
VAITDHLWLILAGPALAALVNGLWPQRHRGRTAHGVLACAAVGVSFLVALAQHLALGASGEESIRRAYFTWVNTGDFAVDFALRLDPLTSIMCLTVTGVGFLIHVYSLGYMAKDPAYVRFFVYLNLFMAAMLLLVTASNLPLLFVGWEGVGLCSYLLIGFWHTRETASRAGFKAFVVNRIGDFGFLLAMLLCLRAFGTLEFDGMLARIGQATPVEVRWITVLLFVGATGKSAQLPLFVWLPDAMEGPTPVSALIHAATMVTAGVYMVVRMSALYHLPTGASALVAWVGGLTALTAATIALAQNDIKRVLAYSTVSQLGYMFLAAGIGAYGAAIFHLVTHAFFKACLFLGSGSVIHACHEEQDILKMGGLRAKMRTTYATFGLSCLAIAGVFPFSGFFSKDEILVAAWSHSRGLCGLGAVAALLTAFYMFRLFSLTFTGAPRMRKEAFQQVHESPPSMTVPLIVLAGLAVIGGVLGLPSVLGLPNVVQAYLGPMLPVEETGQASPPAELGLMVASLLIALVGIGLALRAFRRGKESQKRYEQALAPVYAALRAKWWFDEIYVAILVRPCSGIARFIGLWFDRNVIDRGVEGVAAAVGEMGRIPTTTQTGRVRDYLATILVGAFLLAVALVLTRL